MAPSKKKKNLTEVVIQQVQAFPAIWNKTNAHYKDSTIRGNAWSEISLNMKSFFDDEILTETNLHTVCGLKSHWKNLCSTYRLKKKGSKGKSGAGLEDVEEKVEWPFLEMLRFLDDSGKYGDIKSSSSHVNLPPEEDSAGDKFLPDIEEDAITDGHGEDGNHITIETDPPQSSSDSDQEKSMPFNGMQTNFPHT